PGCAGARTRTAHPPEDRHARPAWDARAGVGPCHVLENAWPRAWPGPAANPMRRRGKQAPPPGCRREGAHGRLSLSDRPARGVAADELGGEITLLRANPHPHPGVVRPHQVAEPVAVEIAECRELVVGDV